MKFDVEFDKPQFFTVGFEQPKDFNVNFLVGSNFDASFEKTMQIVKYGDNYLDLKNKPQIENIELKGNKTLKDLGMNEISNQEILEITNKIFYGDF